MAMKQGTTVIVVYDFNGETENELTVKAGDTLEYLGDGGSGWFYVKNSQGKEGIVPADYLTVANQSQVEAGAMADTSADGDVGAVKEDEDTSYEGHLTNDSAIKQDVSQQDQEEQGEDSHGALAMSDKQIEAELNAYLKETAIDDEHDDYNDDVDKNVHHDTQSDANNVSIEEAHEHGVSDDVDASHYSTPSKKQQQEEDEMDYDDLLPPPSSKPLSKPGGDTKTISGVKRTSADATHDDLMARFNNIKLATLGAATTAAGIQTPPVEEQQEEDINLDDLPPLPPSRPKGSQTPSNASQQDNYDDILSPSIASQDEKEIVRDVEKALGEGFINKEASEQVFELADTGKTKAAKSLLDKFIASGKKRKADEARMAEEARIAEEHRLKKELEEIERQKAERERLEEEERKRALEEAERQKLEEELRIKRELEEKKRLELEKKKKEEEAKRKEEEARRKEEEARRKEEERKRREEEERKVAKSKMHLEEASECIKRASDEVKASDRVAAYKCFCEALSHYSKVIELGKESDDDIKKKIIPKMDQNINRIFLLESEVPAAERLKGLSKILVQMQAYDYDVLVRAISFKKEAGEALENDNRDEARRLYQATLTFLVSLDSYNKSHGKVTSDKVLQTIDKLFETLEVMKNESSE